MLLSTPILLSLLAKAAAFCGTPPPSKAFKAIHAECARSNTSIGLTARAVPVTVGFKPPVVINTYVHVIASSSKSAGNIKDTVVDQQIDVMNEAFAGSGFTFKLQGTTHRYNSSWLKLHNESPREYDMKTALRQGSYNDLNIYFSTLAGNIAGWAYLPDHVNKIGLIKDGLVVNTATAPGGTEKVIGDGKVAVHEAGHWLGLLHTFEANGKTPNNGCDGGGDYIADTPAEKTAATGCPQGRNTCPTVPGIPSSVGVDPIHNHMDYTSSKCKNQFTYGQRARMQAMWILFRGTFQGPYQKGVNGVEDETTSKGPEFSL